MPYSCVARESRPEKTDTFTVLPHITMKDNIEGVEKWKKNGVMSSATREGIR